ncbi:hypothetical protein PF005_g32056 [Phytophthora fragariae]|uniref:RxLR effector protein n=2 Tax=Phytophthora fragariae TaxID=53985 RepID=A0A6A3D866_9STRA|nr:hypothetical protein PF003_g17623 [Phytophthora fragariae]KAE8917612.1 hypothetical protein PF009_g32068 [Phytophthora fragariae]KAE8956863.1 hypothetical protein PF011_g31336 [Phytophthora fragariae]KAE9057810.1 hypothetical protein PF007_g31519 [Phytophthora fragariae]KAE9059129.1 hypothetical protein PF006_g31961 [Phytophthora fragariae]
MRLSYTLLATAAVLLASCNAALAMAESTQVATADRVQPAVVLTNDTPGKRLLRTAKTVGVGEDDEEERGLDLLKKLLGGIAIQSGVWVGICKSVRLLQFSQVPKI